MSYFDFDNFHTSNRKMAEILLLCKQLAKTQASILIAGEAGVGKTSLGRFVFNKSKSPKLHVIECRENQNLSLETGAIGTVFIEDLDAASPAFQSQLMDYITKNEKSRPRFISTARRDLRNLVKQGHFRQDLFYKLAVVHVEVPRLQDRLEDFQKITEFVLDVSQIIHGKSSLHFNPEGFDRLRSWKWPGNIRELENVIERAVVLTVDNEITADDVQFEVVADDVELDFAPGMSLVEVERKLILQTLELTAQNRTKAAQLLGISIRTLRNKLNEYKVEGVL